MENVMCVTCDSLRMIASYVNVSFIFKMRGLYYKYTVNILFVDCDSLQFVVINQFIADFLEQN